MEHSNSYLLSDEFNLHLTNPILLVLSCEDTNRKHQLVNQFCGSICNGIDELMVAHLYGDVTDVVQNDNIISLPVSLDSAHEQTYISLLDKAIRKTKLHNYPNNNDLTVCVFFDSTSGSISLNDFCTKLYDQLTNAYYNHVFFDIYFLLLEEFMPDEARRTQNTNAAKRLSELHKKEWVRYIFLLADVTNKGQMIADNDKLFQMVLTSCYLTNCSTDVKNVGQLQDLLIRESESSKFFCLGQTELWQSEQDIRQLVQMELLQQLSNSSQYDKNIPNVSFCLKTLYADVRNEILKQSCQIEHIGYYSRAMPANASAMTNSSCLAVFFRENPELYMHAVESRCRQHFKERVAQFYWPQFKAWLNDLLHQYNASICIPGCERIIVSKAESLLCQTEQQFQAESKSIRDRFWSWKNQDIHMDRKKRRVTSERFVYQLLDEWRIQEAETLLYPILEMCISDVRSRIKSWQEEIIQQCNLFSKICKEADCGWKSLLNDSNSTKRLLLQYRRDALQTYLRKNYWRIDFCRSHLNSLLGSYGGIVEIMNVISQHAEQLLHESLQSAQSWATPNLFSETDNPEIEALYKELYDASKRDISLNTRRHIPNAEPYICFLGHSQDHFIRYIREQNDFQCTAYFEDLSKSPVAFYFQPLSSTNIFFWKEILEKEDTTQNV